MTHTRKIWCLSNWFKLYKIRNISKTYFLGKEKKWKGLRYEPYRENYYEQTLGENARLPGSKIALLPPGSSDPIFLINTPSITIRKEE